MVVVGVSLYELRVSRVGSYGYGVWWLLIIQQAQAKLSTKASKTSEEYQENRYVIKVMKKWGWFRKSKNLTCK